MSETVITIERWDSILGAWIELDEVPSAEQAAAALILHKALDDDETRYRIITTTTQEVS